MKNILLIKPSSLGDIIHGLPLLKSIKDKWPDAKISWVVKDIYADLLDGNPYIDDLILLKKNSLTLSVFSFAKRLRQGKFDLAIDLQGLFRSGFIAFLSGAPQRVGFENAREQAAIYYTDKVEASVELHAVDRNLKLAASIGCNIQKPEFEINISKEAEKKVSDFFRAIHLNKKNPIITFVPGTRWEKKRWPSQSFSRLGNRLIKQLKANIIFTGSHQEMKLISEISVALQDPSGNATGFSLQELAALIKKSDVLVTNDSGPMHIAAAVGTPVVALFGPTEPARTGPYTENCIVIKKEMDCSPCFRSRCTKKSFECMEFITVDEVFEAVKKLLGK